MDTKTLKIITLTKATKELFTKQLKNLLAGDKHVRIISNSVEEGITRDDNVNLVLSTKLMLHKIDKYVDEDTKVIFAQRSLSSYSIKKLIQIKKNTRALLISNNKLSVQETLSFITKIGINHIDFIPVYPGIDIPRADIAIITGDTNYIPNDLKITNIGRRIIGMSTIVRILLELNLLDQYANSLITGYVKQLVQLSKKLNNQILEERNTNKILEIVIDQVSDGIIYIDKNKEVKIINKTAKKIFNKDLGGEIIDGGLMNTDFDKIMDEGVKELNKYQEIGKDNKIITNILPVKHDRDINGALAICKKVSDIEKLEHDIRRNLKKKGHVAKYTFENIIGTSDKINYLKNRARNIAASNSTILIQGETGTGKEIFAQAIHNQSNYCEGPFVPINCATVPNDLFESELFGYEEGAFTGAKKSGHRGVIEQAHKGTIFLDEIAEIPLNIQSKLLRFLEEEEIMRLGSTEIIPLDVRVIAATNKDLAKMVKNNEFREDLYYRINVLPLKVPPLRQRKEDILVLVKYFMEMYDKKGINISNKAISRLFNYAWPGNIRELKNCVEYISNTCAHDDTVEIDRLPEYIISDCLLVNQNDRELVDIYKLEPGQPEEYLFILNELYLARQMHKSTGRKEISENASINGISLSPHMVRTRCKIMEEKGLINVMKGRQGTTITEKGMYLLKKIQEIGQ